MGQPSDPRSGAGKARLHKAASAGGYAWFMTLGTVAPLPFFLTAYLFQVTLIGHAIARPIYRAGFFSATLGQPPPAPEKLKSRTEKQSDRKPFGQRLRPYTPPGVLERRGRAVPMWVRVIWFLLVGWWLGLFWVIASWALFLFPYPLLDTVDGMLAELPSVMTLAPTASQTRPGSSATKAAHPGSTTPPGEARANQAARGKAARGETPRSAHTAREPPADRP